MTEALILKITLEHRKPLTWRRIAVPTNTTYAQLHLIIQAAFAWDNYHMYGFYPAWNRELTYEDTSADPYAEGIDATTAEILPDLQQGTVQYTYDFGESWDHRIQLEESRDVARPLPICLAGRGAGFYEDGLGEREEAFDLDAVNQNLQEASMPDEQMVAGASTHLDSVVTQDLSKQLALFEHSSQRAEMSEVPSDALSVYVRTFVMMMQDLPVKQWTKAKLKQGLELLVTRLDDDPDSQRTMLIIVGDFIHVMVENHQLAKGMTPNQVDDLMGQVIVENGLMPDDEDWDDLEDPHNRAEETMWRVLDDYYGPLLDQFYQSPEFKRLKISSKGGAVDDLMLDFVATMYRASQQVIDNWQPQLVTRVMSNNYAQQAGVNAEGARVLPTLLSGFTKFLQGRDEIPANQAEALISAFQANAPILLKQEKHPIDDAEYFDFPEADDDWEDDDDWDEAEDWEEDAELDHARLTAIIDHEYGERFSEFFQSKQWLKIDYHDQAKAKSLIASFIGDMISQNSALINDWQPVELTEMMLDFYPAHVVMSDAEMSTMCELLAGFVDFLHQRKAIAAKPANRIIKTIRNNAQHMIELNGDSEMWGPGKEFALKMQAAGVDMSDQAAVDAFVAQQHGGPVSVTHQHVNEYDGRKWRQATATRVHREVAELMEEAHHTTADISIAVEFADEVYAQFLLTPLKWTENVVATVWQQQLTQLTHQERLVHAEAIANHITALGDLRSTSKKQAQRLIDAMQQTTGKSEKIVAFKPRQ
ncbi:plasmid pRiA4b ORF-3 family protein [Lacticaseibacillus manihotivorans]|uniref:Plasmid pRiA4b Orf3-like domain-containing protein n=2 Tax=Lacticaseibacillus manihotivorans TaxID=88233 RepID=A0A0R1QJT7_9LACO|nr:plasmid pRiA4b ORF-3 family protein [Lacticaseibacillus manihotivorans]KRL45078.1 hypothetical protein FD01_GL000867 [Lacticaseibacillus manihotivorans DSM 13343 = JCM 12514]QFQ90965.1 hypothetical protein LM010_05800 [Lacticaseibacillus manihotivorans]